MSAAQGKKFFIHFKPVSFDNKSQNPTFDKVSVAQNISNSLE